MKIALHAQLFPVAFGRLLLIIAIILFAKTLFSQDIDQLVKNLYDDDSMIQNEAFEALSKSDDPRATDALISALDSDGFGRSRDYYGLKAAKALSKKGNQVVDTLIFLMSQAETSTQTKKYSAYVLGESGDKKAVDILTATLNHKDWHTRLYTIEALGKIGDERAILPLFDGLSYSDSGDETAEVIGKLGDSSIVDTLIDIMLTGRSFERDNAAIALGELKDARAVGPLIQQLNDSKYFDNAAIALGKIGDPQAINPLLDALMNGEYNHVVKNAVIALGMIGDSSYVYNLIIATADNDSDIRDEIYKALGKIGNQEAKAFLTKSLSDKYYGVREIAVKTLDEINWEPEDKSQEAAYYAAKGYWDSCRNLGSLSVDPLIIVFQDNYLQDYKRNKAAETLAKIKDIRAIPPLKKALIDWDVNSAAIKSLEMLGWTPVTEKEKIYSMIAKKEGWKLRKDWNMTKTILFEDIASDDTKVIKNALFTFISIGKEEVIPELINILNEKGNKNTAEAYINCGNNKLKDAGILWAKNHSYRIVQHGGSSPTHWGAW